MLFGKKPSSPKRRTAADKNRTIELAIDLDGREISLLIRRHPRARHLTLRLDERTDGAIITMPMRGSDSQALKMVREKTKWILDGLDERVPRVPFADGAVIPFLGRELLIRHRPGGLGVRQLGGEIIVAGAPEHMARRVGDWIKKTAKSEITRIAREKAARIDRTPARITVRDTRTRWGSCGPGGNLNFSWRIAMAPVVVMDYIVAHEVAHLAHHNHGREFWRLAEDLSENMEAAHRWLDNEGRVLWRYG